MAMEEQSTHPIAKAILEYKADGSDYEATNVSEVAGKGLKGTVNGKTVLVGNKALMTSNSIEVPSENRWYCRIHRYGVHRWNICRLCNHCR